MELQQKNKNTMETALSKPLGILAVGGLLKHQLDLIRNLGSVLLCRIENAPLLGIFHIIVRIPNTDLFSSRFEYALGLYNVLLSSNGLLLRDLHHVCFLICIYCIDE